MRFNKIEKASVCGAMILSLALSSSLGTTSVLAANQLTPGINETESISIEQLLMNKCIILTNTMKQTTITGESGFLTLINLFGQYSVYTAFLYDYYDNSDTMSTKSKKAAKKELLKDATENLDYVISQYGNTIYYLNERDNETDVLFGDNTIEMMKRGKTFTRKSLHSFINNKYLKFLQVEMESLAKSIKDLDGTDKDIAISKIRTKLLLVYSAVSGLKDAMFTINSYTNGGFKTVMDDGTETDLFSLVDQAIISNTDLKEIVKLGESLVGSSETSLSFDKTAPILAVLSNAKIVQLKEDYTYTDKDKTYILFEEEPAVSNQFVSLFSCSSVYTPFKSVVGGPEFMEALKSICSEEDYSGMSSLFSAVKDLRKPLYYRKLDDNGLPSGEATLISIQDLIDYVEDDVSGALVSLAGNMYYDASYSSWVYYLDNTYWTYKSQDLYTEILQELRNAWSLTVNGKPLTDTANPEGNESNQDEQGGDSGESTQNSIEQRLEEFQKQYNNTVATLEEYKDGKVSYAYETESDSEKMSDPVLLFGVKGQRSFDNLTSLLLTNIIRDTVNLSALGDLENEYLFVNPLGDIVTKDNVVIFPGAANPIYYRDAGYYYPYTTAFMNYYPTDLNLPGQFVQSSDSSVGKFQMFSEEASSLDNCNAFKIKSVDSVSMTYNLVMPKIYRSFTSDLMSTSEIVLSPRKFNVSLSSDLVEKPVSIVSNVTANGIGVFPYSPQDDTEFSAASAIASAAYKFFSDTSITSTNDSENSTEDTDSSNSSKSTERLVDNYVIFNVIFFGLGGTENPANFTKNNLYEYQHLVNSAYNRFYKFSYDTVNKIEKSCSGTSGIIGLKDPFTEKYVGSFFNLLRTYWLQVMIAAIVVLLIIFAINQKELLSIILKIAVTGIFIYVYLVLVPKYGPIAFNFFTNNLMSDVAYEALAIKTEQHAIKDDVTTSVDKNGQFKIKDSSLTLFRVQSKDLSELYKRFNTSSDATTGGNIDILNQNAGIYLESDSLKVNLDILLRSIVLEGSYVTDEGVPIYQLSAKKTVSSSIDYYTPYYLFLDSFIQKLNDFAKAYRLHRKTTTYAKDVNRDNYLIYSYTHSSVFLTPGQYNKTTNQEAFDSAAEYEDALATEQSLVNRIYDIFGESTDFLGIREVLECLADTTNENYDAYRTSLWGQTLQKAGYFTEDWEPNEESLDGLILKINVQTKKFIFDMEDLVGAVSDETMIKILTLRALTAFTQEASQFGAWLYPFSVNFEDLTISDLMCCLFTSDYNKFIDNSLDTVAYVGTSTNALSMWLYAFCVLLFAVVTYITRYLIIGLYVLSGAIFYFKLVTGQSIVSTFKGLRRCIISMFLSVTILSAVVALIYKFSGGIGALIGLTAVLLAIVFIYVYVIVSILRDPLNFGASKLDLSAANLTSKLPFNSDRNNATIQTANIVTNNVSSLKVKRRLPHRRDNSHDSSEYSDFAKYRERSSRSLFQDESYDSNEYDSYRD